MKLANGWKHSRRRHRTEVYFQGKLIAWHVDRQPPRALEDFGREVARMLVEAHPGNATGALLALIQCGRGLL